MQLLKAKTGKIMHVQEVHRDGSEGHPGVCVCGKAGLLPTDETTAAQIVAKGGAYCPAALGLMEPPPPTSDEVQWLTEPKLTKSYSEAGYAAKINDQMHAYRQALNVAAHTDQDTTGGEPQNSAPDNRQGQTEMQAFAAEMDANLDATLPATHADGPHALHHNQDTPDCHHHHDIDLDGPRSCGFPTRHHPVDHHTKKVRGFRLHHKVKKTKRPRQYAGMNMSAVHQHSRLSGRKMAPASLFTHRAFLDKPGGFMMRQPLGGGDMVPARCRDKAALKANR